MSSAAQVIPLYPEKKPARVRREAGTYSMFDNAVIAYNKTHGTADSRILTALAERHNFTKKRPLTMTELQLEVKLGERAVQKGVRLLEAAGLCYRVGQIVRLGSLQPNECANERANNYSGNLNEKSAPDGFNLPLKEVGRKLEGSTDVVDQFTSTELGLPVALHNPTEKIQEPQAPDGAAPDGARTTLHSQDQLKDTHCDGENVNAQGKKNIPPVGAPTYRACMTAITEAGLLDVWRKWVRLTAAPAVTQEAHAGLWHEWIQAGLTDALRRNVEFLVLSNYGNPAAALVKRMGDAAVKETIIPTSTAELPFREGQRVLYPDGTEAEVLSVRAAGITTDHPTFADMPVSALKALKVLE